jgi:hypothetical protein
MNCPKCHKNNDEDASFCENCGTKLKTLTDDADTKKPLKKESIKNSTKILIIVCVVLIIGVGITVGILFKNSQDPASNNTSTNQISKESGFPVSQAPNLAVQISKYNGNFASVNYGSTTLDQYQCLYILAKAVILINNGENENITIKSIKNPSGPYGTVTSANIAKTDYVNIANRTCTWIDNYGQAPNYVGIKNPGQPDLSPSMALNLFSKVLSQYNSTGQLPSSVTIP